MGKLKLIILIILFLICAFLLFMATGYLIVGLNTPTTLAGREMHFMGAYILCISYGIAFILLTTLTTILLVIWRKKSKKIVYNL